jgi:flagellin
MAFSVNTNLGALQAYNALAKVNAETQKAQLRLATTKRINQVADDTSGFNVGKQMEAQVLKQKAQLNNVSSAKNYLATSESALQQINDKLNQISAKYTDAQDPMKDQSAIAKDISTLATEIKSILQTTNINGAYLLVKGTGGNAVKAQTAQNFDVGGAAFSVDFSSLLGITDADATTGLFGKVSDLTVGDTSLDAAGAEAAGKTAARAYLVGTFTTAVQTKMTEFGLSGAESSNFATKLSTTYDADITAGLTIANAFNHAYATAAADAGSGNVAGAIAQGVQTTGTAAWGSSATATVGAYVWASAAATRTYASTLAGTIATKLGEYIGTTFTANQIGAFGVAVAANIGAVLDAAITDNATARTALTNALKAGETALGLGAGDLTALDGIVAQGVQSTGTAAYSLATGSAAFTTAYSNAVTGFVASPNTAATVVAAAQDVSAQATAVRNALGKIGNLSQSIDSRSEFLTSSIANSTASISSIFDADMAAEQLNATKGNISGQIGTAMLSQLNSAPQQLLSLFR